MKIDHLIFYFSLFFLFKSPLCFASYGTDELHKLVEINSGTNNTTGVDQIQEWTAGKLKNLGFEVEKLDLTKGQLGPLVVATLKGSSSNFITLILHADTVFEPSHPFQKFILSADGKQAKGPGVIDEKGSILVVLNGLEEFLKQAKRPKLSLRVVISPGEEIGSPGLTDKFKELSKESWMILGFEPSLDDGAIVQARRGNRWYHLFVKGKEAHAGRDHAKGINACVELSILIAEISKLTNYSQGTSVSVGHINGGQDKFNIVCGAADAKIDARFTVIESQNKFQQKFDKITTHPHVHSATTGEPTVINYDIVSSCPPYSLSSNSILFLRQYQNAIAKIEGKDPGAEASGGSADTNYFSGKDVILLDGLGASGGKMHTNEEFINLSSLETRSKALAAFLMQLPIANK